MAAVQTVRLGALAELRPSGLFSLDEDKELLGSDAGPRSTCSASL